MTEQEKKLLIVDLSARLTYGVFANLEYSYDKALITSVDIRYGFVNAEGDSETHAYVPYPITCIKPYLRPMSSMTEEEDTRRCAFLDDIERGVNEAIPNYIDWLNKYHFDYRGLIERGLAIEAHDGMYNINNE